MSNSVAIKVENLSKAYQIGEFSTGTISQDIERWWLTKIRGKEDPFLRIGETNDRSLKGESNIVWSLKDVNFNIQQGDAVGIIGKNGAGKSTLLKVLSRVTAPTTGSIKVKGRIASLLEVGTGFHSELTGRENIFLNGAILGMRKHEIIRTFDEIVDFSGVERYIDTPVKRYSSGMYVRLAFAVAAHLESEILIVDEVLAVGDSEFQSKCLNKMDDISRGKGRTILFVSHNISSVRKLCNKGILLKNGVLDSYGNIETIVGKYSELSELTEAKILIDDNHPRRGSGAIKFTIFEIRNSMNVLCNEFSIGDLVSLNFTINNPGRLNNCQIGIQILTPDGNVVYHFLNEDSKYTIELKPELNSFKVILNDIRLYPNLYSLTISITDKFGSEEFDHIVSVLSLKIIDGLFYTNRELAIGTGVHFLKPVWDSHLHS